MTGPRALTARFRNEQGFTLLETMLTLSILVIMLGIVFSAMRMGIRSWEKGDAAAGEFAAARAITSKLAREIGSAYPYRDMADGSDRVLFTGESAELGFVTVSPGHSGLPWGGARWVHYSLQGDILTVREKTVPSAGVLRGEGGSLTELDGKTDRLAFEYLGEDGWAESWSADDRKALPASIRVSITFTDGRKPVTKTVLVGAAGNISKDPALASPAR